MRILILIIGLACAGAAWAGGDAADARQRVEYAMGADRIVSGPTATVGVAVQGDLLLAGGQVVVGNATGGDLVAAGGDVLVDGATGQDLYAAGGRVALGGAVGRNARVVAGTVDVGNHARIAGNATIAGGQVAILGAVQGDLAVAGGRVYLDGPVAGNVDAAAGEIELGPDARITGGLRYRSASPLRRDPGAVVQGAIVRVAVEPAVPRPERIAARVAAVVLAIWTLGLMVLAASVVGGMPRFFARLAQTARTRPFASLLLGFVALVAVPPATALLFATGIGLPLGLVLGAGYLALLLLGYASAAAALGQSALRRLTPARGDKPGWQALAASLAVLVLGLLTFIPVLGWLVCFALWLWGIGALLLQARTAARTATA